MSEQTLSISSEMMVSSITNSFMQEVSSAEKSDEQPLERGCPSFPIDVFPEKIQRIAQALRPHGRIRLLSSLS